MMVNSEKSNQDKTHGTESKPNSFKITAQRQAEILLISEDSAINENLDIAIFNQNSDNGSLEKFEKKESLSDK